MILLNKAHYWVLKQHTDSTPWPLHSKEALPLNGHSCYFHCYRVPAATQSTIPAFCVSCKSVFRDSHHKVPFLNSSNITHQMTWESSKQETKTLYNWKTVKPLLTRRNTEENSSFFPPRRGDSYNYTDHQTALQPENGWSSTQKGPWKGLKHPPRH